MNFRLQNFFNLNTGVAIFLLSPMVLWVDYNHGKKIKNITSRLNSRQHVIDE